MAKKPTRNMPATEAEEKAILKSFERGEWRSVPGLKSAAAGYAKAARVSLKLGKRRPPVGPGAKSGAEIGR